MAQQRYQVFHEPAGAAPVRWVHDSAAGDEEGYLVTPAGYAVLLEALHAVCPALVVVLEGGYNIPAISHSLHACVAALLGVVRPAEGGRAHQCKPQALVDIAATVAAQRPYWACLRTEGMTADSNK